MASHLQKCATKRQERRPPRDRGCIHMTATLSACLRGKDGLVRIPRKKSLLDYLAMNKLVGKIRLTSDMSEGAIFREIRSVFEGPMAGNLLFRFKILQTCGGGSKTLSAPVLSSSFKWTAGGKKCQSSNLHSCTR